MRIGTRGSALALWQARAVARLIAEIDGPVCEIVVIRTSGDESPGPPDAPRTMGPPSLAGQDRAGNVKRLFVKEIEEALVDGRIDVAVHSAKDLPAVLADGLSIGGALEREDPRDALVLPSGANARGLDQVKAALGLEPRVGTTSVRRVAELGALLPAARFVPLRGNVDTRLRKLDDGQCDVLVLAAAGLKRLGLDGRIGAVVPPGVSLPAPGQGIVAVEIADRADAAIHRLVAAITDADAMTALVAERAVVQALGGSCQVPLGVLATVDAQTISIRGSVRSPDGRRVARAALDGNRGSAAATGEKLARQLLQKGAAEILSSLHTK